MKKSLCSDFRIGHFISFRVRAALSAESLWNYRQRYGIRGAGENFLSLFCAFDIRCARALDVQTWHVVDLGTGSVSEVRRRLSERDGWKLHIRGVNVLHRAGRRLAVAFRNRETAGKFAAIFFRSPHGAGNIGAIWQGSALATRPPKSPPGRSGWTSRIRNPQPPGALHCRPHPSFRLPG